jgi:eukaryotic-like serine/threonine-protein kinase
MAGEYRLIRKLGEGGFGAVYEAQHPVLKRRAAVKVLHRAAGQDSDAVRRFVSEAQAAGQVQSRHIVDIFSFGTLPDGRHFYVMDLLQGEALDHYLERETRCNVPDAIRLLTPIAEALDAAHQAGIVHRDLKPQNIFLSWEGDGQTIPKLLDFGLAKLLDDSPVRTASGTPIGTPLYMSPEQARGQKVDARSDVYALGVLCHQLLTGQLPMNGESTIAVLMAHIAQAPPLVSEVASDLSKDLDAPVLAMLEKDPSLRPTSAMAAIGALREAAERAGYGIPSGLPHLPKPPPETHEPALEIDTERETMVRSAEQTQRKASVNRPFLVALVLLGVGGGYLVIRELKRPVTDPVARSSAASSPAASSPAAAHPAPGSQGLPSAEVREPHPPIELAVHGAPLGARILRDGKLLGPASSPIALPFAEQTVELTIEATGYETLTTQVIPNRTQRVVVKLKKREPAPAKRSPIPKDLESPF